MPVNLPLRKLSAETEKRIANAFKQQWQALQPIQAAPWPSPKAAEVTICCDFSFLHSIDAFIEHFYDADICIGMQLLFSYKWSDFNGPGWVGLGMHGAGLANCALGRRGMTLIEFQMQHAFGFDSFMKIG